MKVEKFDILLKLNLHFSNACSRREFNCPSLGLTHILTIYCTMFSRSSIYSFIESRFSRFYSALQCFHEYQISKYCNLKTQKFSVLHVQHYRITSNKLKLELSTMYFWNVLCFGSPLSLYVRSYSIIPLVLSTF